MQAPDTKPKRGRPKGSGYNIAPSKVAALRAQGMTLPEVAEALGVSRGFAAKLAGQYKENRVSTDAERLERFSAAVVAGNRRAIGLLDQWEPTDVNAHTLDRTGQPPLRFSGRLLREGSTKQIFAKEGKFNHDWWDVQIYSIEDDPPGKYVVSIVYSMQLKGVTRQTKEAFTTDDPAKVIAEYDPLKRLQGFPEGERYAALQKHLERSTKAQYGELVSQLLRDPI